MVGEAVRARLSADHDDRAWLAWNTAALGRVTKLPDLKKWLARKPVKRKAQSPERMAEAMDAWVVVTGGKE